MKDWRFLGWTREQLIVLEAIDEEIKLQKLSPKDTIGRIKKGGIRPKLYTEKIPITPERISIVGDSFHSELSSLQDFFEFLEKFTNGGECNGSADDVFNARGIERDH